MKEFVGAEIVVVVVSCSGLIDSVEPYVDEEDAFTRFKEVMGVTCQEFEKMQEDADFSIQSFIDNNDDYDAQIFWTKVQ